MALPVNYLILPDPEVTRARLISSTSPGSGRHAGPPVPGDDNQGDLLPFLDGTPAADVNVDLRIHATGGLDVGAEWGWKYDGDAAAEWRGQDDERYPRFPHDPFSSDVREGYGTAILVSEVWDRVLLFRYNGGSPGNTFSIRYRSISGGALETWSSTSATFTLTLHGAPAQVCGVELADGEMRLFVPRLAAGSVECDIDMYGSSDSGLTWTRLIPGLLKKWTGALTTNYPNRLSSDTSGDWIRLAYVDAGDRKAHTLVSSDRGATWTALADVPASGTVQTNGNTDDAYGLFTFCGADADDGTFLMAMVRSADPALITWYRAARDEDWTTHGYTLASSGADQLVSARAGAYIWFLSYRDNGGTTRSWQTVRVDRRDVYDTDSFQYSGDWPGFDGSVKVAPAFVQMRAVGAHLIVLHALLDTTAKTVTADGCGLFHLLGWTRQSLYRDDASTFFDSAFFTLFWSTLYGLPSTAVAAPWTAIVVGGGSATWTPHETELVTHGAGETSYFQYDDGPAPANPWPTNSVFVWQAKAAAGGTAETDRAAVRIVGYATATQQTDVSLRMTAGGTFAAFDNIAGATLAVWGGLAFDTSYRCFRVAFEVDATEYRASIWSAPATTDAQWSGLTVAEYVTLTKGASALTSNQLVRWGNLVAPVGVVDTFWREFGFDDNSNKHIYRYTSPGDSRGRVCSGYPTVVTNGLRVRWAGGGGFVGDTFDADLYYDHGLDAAFTATRMMGFRSSSLATQSWVFDADATIGIGRWDHDAAIACGLETATVSVQYHTSDSWGAPSAAVTLSGVVYSGVTLSGTDGDVAVLPNVFVAGELAGLRMRHTASGATVNVTRHDHNQRIRCEEIATALTAQGFATGTTVSFFRDTAVASYVSRQRYRFMRVVLPAGLPTSTGDVRLACLGIGTKLSLDVPFDWEWTETDTPNVSAFEAASGLRMSYRRGAPRRTVTGGLAGGETTRFRETARALLDQVSEHGNRPMGLVLDSANAAASVLWCRWVGAVQLDQQGWKQDASGVWRQVGEMAMSWEEEL